MIVRLMPNKSQRFSMIIAATIQQILLASTIGSMSYLEVCRVQPAGSPIFRLVREGRLQELRKMLQRGKASLRDHDENGRSLLFVSNLLPLSKRMTNNPR